VLVYARGPKAIPHQAKNLRAVEAALPNHRVLSFGFDDSHPGMIVAYIVDAESACSFHW
jgi:hypothetical protein